MSDGEIEALPKPPEFLALTEVTAELFDTLKDWFDVPTSVLLDLSAALSASCTSIVTRPVRSLVLHWPQIPERHSNGMSIPASSAISRMNERASLVSSTPSRIRSGWYS